MRSVTEQLELEHGLDNALDTGGEPGALKALVDEGIAKQALDVPQSRSAHERQREAQANAKLRVAFALRQPQAKPTGVKFVSQGHDQVQEIFDDGSVRNPYKTNREMTGRQRRRMRKHANAQLKQRGIPGRIEDVLKGRRVGTPERPQPVAMESPAPANVGEMPGGTPVAAVFGD